MAGILDKKSRLIDYKLTEHGRKQTASGNISFKYYTFSDNSIVYHEKLHDKDRASDSEFFYLPFEITTDPGFYVNPEYSLTNELSYEENNNSFFEINDVHNTFQTTIENLKDQKYLYTKKIKSNSIFENINNFIFTNAYEKDLYDFIDDTFIRKYPTVDFFAENIKNLQSVDRDDRFKDTLKYKKMSPIDLDGNNIISNTPQSYEYDVNCIYKSLTLNMDFSPETSKDKIISKVISAIEENKEKFHYLNYELSSKNFKSNDEYLFEMHEKIDENTFKKIPFYKLGSFFDVDKNRNVDIYLIGKFIQKDINDESFNIENNTTYVNNIDKYYFINMFTLVIEKWLIY